jgi:acetoin utilization deacetylase AcuC-like enzyme
MLMIEQQAGVGDAQPWIVGAGGRRMRGHDHDRRLAELRAGLLRHGGVRAQAADALDERLERTLGVLHEPGYLDALGHLRSRPPALMAELTAPGMAPDTPVCAGLARVAREGVRTAITAAQRLAAGSRFSYALCRPPGHHAGPSWLGGYCLLNNAAAAAQTLREGGVAAVGILDLDIHYPNGTSAIAADMSGVVLHSIHAAPVVNSPAGVAEPRSCREHLVAFTIAPSEGEYLEALHGALELLRESSAAIVLSLGYDTVRGDPHGSWRLTPAAFGSIGALLSASGLPVCVVQEGGYALESLADCSAAFASGLLASGVR